MFELHAVQAKFGDCLIIEFGNETPAYILIDGGPNHVYEESLKPALDKIIQNNKLEAVMISHIDLDHIRGIMDLLTELKRQQDAKEQPFIGVEQLWLNTFSATVDPNNSITQRMNTLNAQASKKGVQMNSTGNAVNAVSDGHKITQLCKLLRIEMNPSAVNKIYCVDDNPKTIKFGNLNFTIVGPTRKNLDKLKKNWENWLQKNEDEISRGNFNVLGMSDNSVPNLSSIAFLVEGDGKTILFTGDSRGDHVKDGLEQAGKLKDGKLHLDVLKVQHHGSARNSDAKFFNDITADTYVISADGTNDNPDYQVLTWIAEAAKKTNRKIKFVITNQTPSTREFEKSFSKAEYNFDINYIPAEESSIKV
jgi:beta-lactamase superfamily II metal-dependent hydrolase